jgi:hypothetical protein
MRKALQIVFVEKKRKLAPLRLGAEIFVDHHRVAEVVSRNVPFQVAGTPEPSEMFIELGRGKNEIQVHVDITIQFGEQVISLDN